MSLDSDAGTMPDPTTAGRPALLPPLGALEILAAGPDAFLFVDGELRTRYMNPAAEWLVGRRATSLYGAVPWLALSGALAQRAEQELHLARDGQTTVSFTEVDERGAHLELTAYPAAGGIAVFIRDVTGETERLRAIRTEAAAALGHERLEREAIVQELTRAHASLAYARHAEVQTGEQFTALMDGIGDVVAWYDASWRWIHLNEAGRLLLARLGRPGDAIGLTLWDTLPQLHGTRLEAALRRAAAERCVVELEVPLDDTGEWFAHRLVPLPDGSLLAIARDITARRRERDLLRANEARFHALSDAATQMVWTTDAAGQVLDLPRWRALTGQTPDEVRGTGWADAIHPDDVAATLAAFRAAVDAGTSYEAQYRLRMRDGSYRWQRARGVPVRSRDGTVREWVGLLNEVDRMVRRDEGMRFLAEASAVLTATLDERTTLDSLARLAVDWLADGAMISLVRDGGEVEHVATRSRDGRTADYAAETERLYPLPREAESGYQRAIRTGESELVPADAFRDDILPRIAAGAAHLERLRALDMYSGMVVPLIARGATLGAMTLVLHGPTRRRPFDAEDLGLATELARRAALALDNARLYDAERESRAEAERAAELTRRLQEITASFARTITINEVAATALSYGLDALSARSGVVYLLAEGGAALEMVRREGVPDELLQPFRHIPLTAPSPLLDVIRAGEVLDFDERVAVDDRYSAVAALGARIADGAWAMIPLQHAGRALGAIGLGFPPSHRFTVHERALLDAVGRHAAQALERARLLDAERDARDEAERANEAKSELLAKVSHETRQPVHASIGWVDTLEMELHGALGEAQRDALRRIKQNQLRLLSVLNDLLDMSRIEAGKLAFDLRAIVVADVVDAVESAVAPQMRAKGLRFDFERPDHDVRVRADVDQLIGILTNLLGNAAKFTPDGGEVTVRCDARDDTVLIAVRDTGIGIAAPFTDRVFEPFFQVERGFTRTTMGTGLGLAISRESARAMSGEVTVESEVGVGSCFTLRLPRAG
jgi:PAS domain S-box-containing protein